ncbi:MAG: hypothetical protein ABS882_10370, partial [Lysinibacillus sp.]
VLNWGNFLYFPEDKSTYLPAFIQLAIMLAILAFVFRWIRKYSAKQAAEAKKLEERALAERAEREKQDSLI